MNKSQDTGFLIQKFQLQRQPTQIIKNSQPTLGSGNSGDVIMSFVEGVRGHGQDSEEEKPPKHAFGDVRRLQKNSSGTFLCFK